MSYSLEAENASVRAASNNPILVIVTLFVLVRVGRLPMSCLSVYHTWLVCPPSMKRSSKFDLEDPLCILVNFLGHYDSFAGQGNAPHSTH